MGNRQSGDLAESEGHLSWKASVMWALTPLLTLGWGAGFSFTYAAVRLRSRAMGIAAAAYISLGAISFLLVNASRSDSDWQGGTGTALALALMAVGTAHAFAFRRNLIDPTSQFRRSVAGLAGDQAVAIASAKTQLRRRNEAREILAADPVLAHQLRIGRPDLPRRFDDGGLVDVNHAAARALATVPGIDPDLANRIVGTRDDVGGFNSLEDLSITLGVSPQRLDIAKMYLVFPGVLSV